MKHAWLLARVTFIGGVRDRFLLSVVTVFLFLMGCIPIFSSFSMRDVLGVASVFSLSVLAAAGGLLTVLSGSALISRDLQTRSIHSVVSLPLTRSQFLMGKLSGVLLLLTTAIGTLGLLSLCGLLLLAHFFPPDLPFPVVNYLVALLLDIEKLAVLASVLLLFSVIATSSSLPVILTLAVYVIGESTEKVRFFVESGKGGQTMSPVVKGVTQVAYYVFPNFSLFDLKTAAVYGTALHFRQLVLTMIYGVAYAAVLLGLACLVFRRKDLP